MTFIIGNNLGKIYGQGDARVHSLKGVNVEVAQGEFVAVMGASGSGKSTLLSILGALNRPTNGLYYVDGINVYDLNSDGCADFRRDYLGFVFQNFHLAPYLTLVENVMLPLATRRLKSREKRAMAEEALSRVGLLGKEDRLPNQVSGGEQERAAIARAVVNQPPILMADEPTGNLDEATGQEVMGLLQNLNDQGMTIIMVTHSREYASYADRILRMRDGQLEYDKTLNVRAA